MTTINLISGPRNISTALMYSFAQRKDCVVFDEPFYAVYLKLSDANHPGKQEVLSALPQHEADVRTMIEAQSTKAVAFVKNMAHHIEVLDQRFLPGSVNLFLIRDPLQIITSYSKVIENPVMRDIGIAYQWQLFEALRAKGERPVVLDSNQVLENPEGILRKTCHACGIEFDPYMLRWKAGPKPYDGVWAPYWYANVHRSTGFDRQISTPKALKKELEPLYLEAKSHYEKLLPFSVKA